MISNIFKRTNIDRIGPDILSTYWRFFFKNSMFKYCKSKFYKFGDGSEIRPGAYIVGCSQISIGKNVIIRPGSMFHGETNSSDVSIIIEDDVAIGSGVHIYVENHRYDIPNIPILHQGHYPSKPVKLEAGAWIGANVIILPGVKVGKNSVVGAGSIVTMDVPERMMVFGNPAKIIKKLP
jgi:acetyltransferase-like isoleucine patch superfamily enzyme